MFACLELDCSSPKKRSEKGVGGEGRIGAPPSEGQGIPLGTKIFCPSIRVFIYLFREYPPPLARFLTPPMGILSSLFYGNIIYSVNACSLVWATGCFSRSLVPPPFPLRLIFVCIAFENKKNHRPEVAALPVPPLAFQLVFPPPHASPKSFPPLSQRSPTRPTVGCRGSGPSFGSRATPPSPVWEGG